jgi:hypothetical protein
MWGGGCAPECACMGGRWACLYPPCLQTMCPASAPAQYSQCYDVGLACPYPNIGTCNCESPGTWFCNTGAGSGGSSGGGSGGGCPPEPTSPCTTPGLMCSYAAACGAVECVCNGGGGWGCSYPVCDGG